MNRPIIIRKLFFNYGSYPIRWLAVLEDWSTITIRERGNECVIFKGLGSIFGVDYDESFIFETKESSNIKVLDEILDRPEIVLLPNALEFAYIFCTDEEVLEWITFEKRKDKLIRILK